MPTATELFHPRDGRFLRRTADGWSAARVFNVDTPDEYLALTAAGVPQDGQLHPSFPIADLRVRQVDVARVVGEKPDPSAPGGVSGWCRVTASYATPGLRQDGGGVVEIPRDAMTPGAAYLDWAASQGTATVYTDLAGVALVGDGGAPVPASALDLLIRKFVTRPPDPAQYAALLDRLNDAPFTMPEFYGASGPPRTVAARQVLFAPPSVRRVDVGLFEVVYRLPFKNDWKDRRRRLNAEGQPVGPVIESDIIPTFSTTLLVGLLNQAS